MEDVRGECYGEKGSYEQYLKEEGEFHGGYSITCQPCYILFGDASSQIMHELVRIHTRATYRYLLTLARS